MKTSILISLTLSILLAGAGCAKKSDTTTPSEAQKKPCCSAAKAKPAPSVETAPATPGALAVLEIAACRSVEERTPVGAGDTFPSSVGRVYVFTKVGLDAAKKDQIKHVWRFQGKEVATITLPVEGPQWRTYSSKSIDGSYKGAWQVDILGPNDALLRSVSFNIE